MSLTYEGYCWDLVILPLIGWKSVSEVWAWSESELPPRVQVTVRALFVQVEEGGCSLHSHRRDSYHVTWFQVV